MTRTFEHTFDPQEHNPIKGNKAKLTVCEIEDAGLREILQTPGAGFGSWRVLENLLDTSPAFVFREPLGQAREVKVALSGLFGRFVARAYLEKYFGLSFFAHTSTGMVDLDRRHSVTVKRRSAGDLPDWIACSSRLAEITIAEAKGCHDRSGPTRALTRAWKQANRIDVVSHGGRLTLKRLAIATRWGMSTGGPKNPWIAVQDPEDPGDKTSAKDEAVALVGVVRHHLANILAPLGHEELAETLRQLTNKQEDSHLSDATQRGLKLLDESTSHMRLPNREKDTGDSIVGGIVTRAGPLANSQASDGDVRTLSRLDLRPVHIGVRVDLVRAAIRGDPSEIRAARMDGGVSDRTNSENQLGGQVVRLS